MNFTQHVLEPTHTSSHILDLLMTPTCTSFVRSVEISTLISDHFAVHSQLEIHKPPPKNKTVSFRKFKAIDRSEFRCDMVNSNLNESSSVYLENMVSNYNSTIPTLIDKHAPLLTRCIPIRQTFPWYSDNIAQAKKDRRQAERHYRNNGLEIHREIFEDHRENLKKLITHSKSKYFEDKIIESGSDCKSLFKIIDTLMKRKPELLLSSSSSFQDHANKFALFFHNKIENIRVGILEDKSTKCSPPPSNAIKHTETFHTFLQVTVEENAKLL